MTINYKMNIGDLCYYDLDNILKEYQYIGKKNDTYIFLNNDDILELKDINNIYDYENKGRWPLDIWKKYLELLLCLIKEKSNDILKRLSSVSTKFSKIKDTSIYNDLYKTGKDFNIWLDDFQHIIEQILNNTKTKN